MNALQYVAPYVSRYRYQSTQYSYRVSTDEKSRECRLYLRKLVIKEKIREVIKNNIIRTRFQLICASPTHYASDRL